MATLTRTEITRDALMMWENSLVMSNKLDWKYSKKFGATTKIGEVLPIRRPVLTQASINNLKFGTGQSVQETKVLMAVSTTISNPLVFTEKDMALRIDDFSQLYIVPSVTCMANTFDSLVGDVISHGGLKLGTEVTGGLGDSIKVFSGIAGWVYESAAAGVLTSKDILKAKNYLIQSAIPEINLWGVLSPEAMAELTSSQATLFHADKALTDAYLNGYIGKFAGINFNTSNNTASHTNGATATIAVSAGTGNLTSYNETDTIEITALATTLQRGDVFTVAGVYHVNDLSKKVTNTLKQFTVIDAFVHTDMTTSLLDTATGTIAIGADRLTISPCPVISGPNQNVSTSLASKTGTLVGGVNKVYEESYIFATEAIAAVSPRMYADDEVTTEAISSETDLSIRYSKAFDFFGVRGAGNQDPSWCQRLDVQFGVKILNPLWVLRLRIKAA
jgi:hypothetical protein